MKELSELCQPVFIGIGRCLNWFFGDCDSQLRALLVVVVLNVLTHFMRAVTDRTASETSGFQAVCQKVLIFGMVGISHIFDTQIINTDSFLRTPIILYYVSNESISLIKNAEHLGLSIPSKLKRFLK